MKTCRACHNDFEPMRQMQRACSPLCALAIAQAKREIAERREVKQKLLAIKPRKDWLKEAQSAFNAYVRERDRHLACISCGRNHQGQYHAGHFLSTGARPELRFDEDNVHKQCQPCNTHLHGNLILYRVALIARIGHERVSRLEGPHPAMKYDIAALKLIRDTYRARTRVLLEAQKLAA